MSNTILNLITPPFRVSFTFPSFVSHSHTTLTFFVLAQDLLAIKEEMEELRRKKAALAAEKEELERMAHKAGVMYNERDKELKTVQKQVAVLQGRVRILRMRRHLELHDSKLKDLALSFESGSYADVSDELASMELAPEELDSRVSEEAQRIFDQEAAIRLDYSTLSDVSAVFQGLETKITVISPARC